MEQPKSNQSDNKVRHITSGYSSLNVNIKTRTINAAVTLAYMVPASIGLVVIVMLCVYLFTLGVYIPAIIIIVLELVLFSWFIGLALAQSKIIELHDALGVKIGFNRVISLALHRSLAMTGLVMLRFIYFLPRYSLAPYFLIDTNLSPHRCLEYSTALIEGKKFGKQYGVVVAESLIIQTIVGNAFSSSAAANTLAQKYVAYVRQTPAPKQD